MERESDKKTGDSPHAHVKKRPLDTFSQLTRKEFMELALSRLEKRIKNYHSCMVGCTIIGNFYMRIPVKHWQAGDVVDEWAEEHGLPNGVESTCSLPDCNPFEWKNVRLVILPLRELASDYDVEKDKTHISVGYYIHVLQEQAKDDSSDDNSDKVYDSPSD